MLVYPDSGAAVDSAHALTASQPYQITAISPLAVVPPSVAEVLVLLTTFVADGGVPTTDIAACACHTDKKSKAVNHFAILSLDPCERLLMIDLLRRESMDNNIWWVLLALLAAACSREDSCESLARLEEKIADMERLTPLELKAYPGLRDQCAEP